MNPRQMDPREAQAALDQVTETKRAMAEKSSAPRGYHALLGLALAVLVVGVSAPLPWIIIGDAAGLVLLGVAARWYRSAVGTWAWAVPRGKGSWAYWIFALAALGCVVASALAKSLPLGIALGVVVLVATAFLGPLWDRAYIAQARDRK